MSTNLTNTLQTIEKRNIPRGMMRIKTTKGKKEIELYGTNGNAFRIPIEKADDFVQELKETCTNPCVSYPLGYNGTKVEIPGFKLPSIMRYMDTAKDIGIELGEYNQIF